MERDKNSRVRNLNIVVKTTGEEPHEYNEKEQKDGSKDEIQNI
jgi:hypothetical protein